MEKVNSLLEFIKLAVLTTAGQLITLLGIFFVFGLLLYLLARFTGWYSCAPLDIKRIWFGPAGLEIIRSQPD